MAAVTLIEAPYHLGRRGIGMGLGPGVLIRAGLGDAIRKRGASVEHRSISIEPAGAAHEIGGVMAVSAAVAREVVAARERRALPLVLVGDCAISAGVLAGIGAPVGIVWFDAHGDFNTPETTVSGYFNGMALSMAAGKSWRGLLAGLEGFRAADDHDIVLAGGRAFDPAEEELLAASAITVVPIQHFQPEGAFERALDPPSPSRLARPSSG